MTYVDLACTQAAFVKDTAPSTNAHGAAQYQLAGPQASTAYGGNRLLLAFEELQGEYRYRKVFGMSFKLPISRNVQSSPYVYVHALDEVFDEATVTWETQPRSSKYFYEGAKPSDGSGDEVLSITPYLSSKKDDYSEASLFAVKAPGFYIRTGGNIYNPSYFVDAYTNAAAAGNRPYLHVSLSDTPATVDTELTYPINYTDTFDHSKPVTFTWKSDFLGRGRPGFTEPVAPIVQTSATLYWKESDSEGSYNEIQISGPEQSYTFPDNILPARNITWYVEPTFEGYSGYRSGNGFAAPRIYVDLPAQDLAGVFSLQPDSTLPWTGSEVIMKFNHFMIPDQYKYLLAQFGSFPTAFERLAAVKSGIVCATIIFDGQRQGLIAYALASRFDPRSVTWNTKPPTDALHSGGYYDNSAGASYVSIPEFFSLFVPNDPGTDVTKSTSAAAVATTKAPAFQLQPFPSIKPEGATDWDDAFSVHEPVALRVMLLDQIVTSKPAAITNAAGYVNPHVAQVFRWEHVPDGDYWCVAGWTTASATLYWRQAGASTWNSVAATAGSSEVSLAAETLPAGSVEWYVTATDDQGTTASSEIYTISTADTLHTATPVYPIDTTENGEAGIRFIWTDASDTGAAPTGADLQYSDDQGATWTDFASPRTSATQYDAPGGGFPSGVLLWRVRSLNAEGTAGPWSEAVSFLCFAAPDPPILDSDGKPFLTVTWQSAGQRAYRIIVDGKAYGPYFGDSKSFTVPEYLTDGSHVVRVEVQNEYGLWNGAEITVTVANIPGEPVILSGRFDRDAALRWTCEDATADFLIYRDDVQIGHSSGYSFTDRTVLGFHSWRVINRLPGGYYTASNTVSGTLCTEGLALALLAGGPWLDLTLSTNAIRTTTAAAGRSVVLRQFAGREYPDAEAAPYKTLQISFDVSWTPAQAAQARAFEALIGEAVIFKEPGEEAFVGVLSAFQRSHSFSARSYTATVQRIHWKEYVDADS